MEALEERPNPLGTMNVQYIQTFMVTRQIVVELYRGSGGKTHKLTRANTQYCNIAKV